MPDQTLPPQHQKSQPGHESEMNPKPDYAPKFPGAGRLAGKSVVITGGDSGIGRAVAVAMAREGASVAIVYKEEHEDAQETIRLIEAEGSRGLAIAGDVGQEALCREAVDKTVSAFGGLDVLVNNAAEQHQVEDITGISEQQLERTFRTNIFSYFFMAKAARPHLKAGSSIINTTSVTAYKGSPQLLDYSSTKGAIVAFTRSLSMALAKDGVRVNAVAPGPIWTPLIPATFDAEKVKSFGADVPMARPGQPREVASAYVFLASEDGSYVSGQVIHPNGGTIVNG
ncbi:SDR family oxidoreductase [Alsobacter sp. SYSU BS001988]|jgi:NAD(P)-dependent dehydrogenase (short-subunit alcohol dehydrogenase family)